MIRSFTMNMGFTLAVLAAILGVALWRRYAEKRSAKPREQGNREEGSEELMDLNERFLAAAVGRQSVALVRSYNPEDVMVLRSLLDSAGIASYVRFQNMNSLYPKIVMGRNSDVLIDVFADELEEARLVAEDYIDRLKAESGASPHSKAAALRNAAEMAIGGIIAPDSETRLLPELLVPHSQ
jgi:hypothetical protein